MIENGNDYTGIRWLYSPFSLKFYQTSLLFLHFQDKLQHDFTGWRLADIVSHELFKTMKEQICLEFTVFNICLHWLGLSQNFRYVPDVSNLITHGPSYAYTVPHKPTMYLKCLYCTSYAYTVRHVPILCLICLYCTSYAYNVRHVPILCLICLYCASYAYTVPHMPTQHLIRLHSTSYAYTAPRMLTINLICLYCTSYAYNVPHMPTMYLICQQCA